MHAETRPYTTIEANISKLHTFLFVNYVKWIFANMCSRRSLGIKMAEMNVCKTFPESYGRASLEMPGPKA